ncbi:hypothetical protein A9974_19460 [Achromobacter sp. UMC71]|nr:hypothetical protein [Achromobacter sp. UMC71]
MIECCAEYKFLLPQLNQANVEEMSDGGMGSLLFCSLDSDRSIGREVARKYFLDEDGIAVSVVLNIDNYGNLYELDVWKADFSELISFPRE